MNRRLQNVNRKLMAVLMPVLGILVLGMITGCSAKLMNKEALAAVAKVGVLSVSVEKINPDSDANEAVLKMVADRTRKSLESSLKSEAGFKVVSAANLAKNKYFRNAGTVAYLSGAQAYLKNEAETDPKFAASGSMTDAASMADAFKAMLGGGVTAEQKSKAVSNFTKISQKQLDSAKKQFVGAAGMPLIPYHIFNENKQGVIEHKVTMGNAQEDKNYMKEMMLAAVGKLCSQLGLDAMVIAYVSTDAPPLGNIRVISGDRCLGTVKMNTTLVMIDKNGRIIADTGWRTMDDLAPNRMGLPMYKVTKWKRTGKTRTVASAVTDFSDPSGKVKKELVKLADEVAANAVKEVADAMKSE